MIDRHPAAKATRLASNSTCPRWPGSSAAYLSSPGRSITLPPSPSPGDAHHWQVWQWNDPWPAISWNVIDAFGQPKQSYETLRRIYQPVLVSLEYALRAYRPGNLLCGTLWVVNDRIEALQDCYVTAWLDDEPVYERGCSLPAGAAAPVGELAVALPASFATLRLTLHHRNTLLASNVYDLRFHDDGPHLLDRVLRRRLVDAILG